MRTRIELAPDRLFVCLSTAGYSTSTFLLPFGLRFDCLFNIYSLFSQNYPPIFRDKESSMPGWREEFLSGIQEAERQNPANHELVDACLLPAIYPFPAWYICLLLTIN